MAFEWTCPYCGRDTTITDNNYSIKDHYFNHGNCQGALGLRTTVLVCPNPSCGQFAINAALYKQYSGFQQLNTQEGCFEQWNLKPGSCSKVYPDYIPSVLREDYKEACSIVLLSPKASATLSRRCLQGMIRDYWSVSKGRLVDEIKAIEDKVDPLSWDAIEAVRKFGNIGAHMEKDINVIINVDPGEAEMLIHLIETLFEEWYIERHERQQKLNKLVNAAKDKQPTT